ncbi:divalent-cation tolerance protein CutA [Marilutibacter chinensis]|uniref:Divalent-cation tolerance protein CutA n=1 Tax=Marilutibacter chinensis TaxID=2912247 RepID=A0ABS9HYX4_9GAMM|nr:divalent-cation tolerance protein CutA [Lysobacter chinensis]MCF7223282.1 divalent-cation tolerance protein CutA [Lysobacter chinensis]
MSVAPSPPVLLVHCTCPDDASAARLAEALVEERLAACVSRLPGLRSTYRWQGTIEQADEVLLLIKTRADRLEALAARVQALHPYELPELVAVEARGGLAPYLQWVAEQTRSPDPQE